MKSKILLSILVLLPITANAAIPYRVERIEKPIDTSNDVPLSGLNRFYIGGAYNFSIWGNSTDNNVKITGENTSSFEAMIGVRATETIRVEANYIHTSAKWDAFSLTGETAMLNAIVDARIDSLYRLFYKQHLVPYVGIGAGVSWNSADGVTIEDKISPVAAAMAGLSVEIGEYFALDFGYRYMYMFSPRFNEISDFSPSAHQFRVGARIHF